MKTLRKTRLCRKVIKIEYRYPTFSRYLDPSSLIVKHSKSTFPYVLFGTRVHDPHRAIESVVGGLSHK